MSIGKITRSKDKTPEKNKVNKKHIDRWKELL